jgi:hypothetical protein
MTKLTRLSQRWERGRTFRFHHQGQPSLDQDFTEHEPIGLRARPHDQCQVLFNFNQPSEISSRIEQLACSSLPSLAIRKRDRLHVGTGPTSLVRSGCRSKFSSAAVGLGDSKSREMHRQHQRELE